MHWLDITTPFSSKDDSINMESYLKSASLSDAFGLDSIFEPIYSCEYYEDKLRLCLPLAARGVLYDGYIVPFHQFAVDILDFVHVLQELDVPRVRRMAIQGRTVRKSPWLEAGRVFECWILSIGGDKVDNRKAYRMLRKCLVDVYREEGFTDLITGIVPVEAIDD